MNATHRRVIGIVAAATWITIDLVRGSGPLLSQLFDVGVATAAGTAIATFVIGGVLAYLATFVGERAGHGRVLVAAAVTVVALRLLVPLLEGEARIIFGLVAVSMSIALLLLAVRVDGVYGGGAAVLAASGMGAIAALIAQGVLGTWDAVWRDDLLAWAVTLIMCGLVVASAVRARRYATGAAIRGLWAYGLWLSMVLYAFANLAYIASQSGTRMGTAVIIGAVGAAAGIWLSSRKPNVSMPVVAAIGLLTLFSAWSAFWFDDTVTTLMLPVAFATATYLVSRIVHTNDDARPSSFRFMGATAVFGLMTVLPFMVIQLDYDVPVGFPAALTMPLVALAIVTGAVYRARKQEEAGAMLAAPVGFRRRSVVAALASVVAGIGIGIVQSDSPDTVPSVPSELTVVSWNIHYSVLPALSGGPSVVLEDIAQAIEAENADVVLLQEGVRGWVLSGGADSVLWLAERLNMYYEYAPAHDAQFGNAILSKYPLTNAEVIQLPYGDGPQGRSAIAATLSTSAGDVEFVSIHLQHKEGNNATRVAEVEAFLVARGDSHPIVVGGDFNAVPGSDPILAMLGAEFGSVQDNAGAPDEDTYVGADFQDRIDYAFYKNAIVTNFRIVEAHESDHLPLAFTVIVGPLISD